MSRAAGSKMVAHQSTMLTTEQIDQWHALRMMIGFCREEAETLGADFLVYCLDLGIVAADDHMRSLEARADRASA